MKNKNAKKVLSVMMALCLTAGHLPAALAADDLGAEVEKSEFVHKAVDCGACDGAGSVTCESCDGEGKIEENCDACGGTGMVDGEDCEACGGAGTVEGEDCEACNGAGSKTCEECDGAGEVACDGTESTNTINATCTEDGKVERRCETCGASDTTTILATGHKHADTDEGEVLNEPGCNQYGTKRYTCTECGDPYLELFGEKGTHDWSNWETVTAATCGKDGTKTRSCSKCHEQENEKIPATGNHQYDDDGICLECGDDKNPAPEMTESELLERITAAPAGETVYLKGNVKLTQALNITKNLSLVLDNYTLSAAEGYTGGLIKVSNANVEIIDGKLTGATGNAVYAEGGNLTMVDCTVTGNAGGAVKAMNVDNVTITGCNFSRNVSNGAGGALFVYNAKTLEVYGGSTGGSFVDNLALEGSAVYCGNLGGTTNVIFNNVRFERNGVEGDRLGGAGALYLLYGINATIQNCEFVGNGSTKNGGAIIADGSAGAGVDVSVEGCTFDGNKTNKCGGAIYGDSAKSLTVTDSDFTGNIAVAEGGAIYNLSVGKMAVTGGSFNGNQSNTWGGAIYNYDSAATVAAGTVITNNIATYGGGGIMNYSGDLTVAEGAKVYNNTANYYGHDIYNGGTSTITLPAAAGMNGQREGKNITGWYMDEQDNRWGVDNCTLYTPAENDSKELALVAAYEKKADVPGGGESTTPTPEPSDDGDDDGDDDDDDDEPTVIPSTTPSAEPSTTPSSEPIDIPEENVPLTEAPEELVELVEEDVPLAETPDEVVEIVEEDVPLSDAPSLPQTGLNWLPAALLAVGGVSSSAAGLLLQRKKNDEE